MRMNQTETLKNSTLNISVNTKQPSGNVYMYYKL